jgi:DNA polymerase-3 subunit delta
VPAYVIYGDGFLVFQALQELRAQVGHPDVLEANSHRLARPSPGQLREVCDAVPFLAAHRLVLVEGVLAQFESRDPRRRGSRRLSGPGKELLAQWEDLPRYIAEEMPPTTLLTFLEERLSRENILLRRLRPVVQVQELPTPAGEPLSRWIRNRIAEKGARISPGAIRLLSQGAGDNLWALDNDLEKLALYAGDRPIEEGDVGLLVFQSREANIFTATDALLEGKSRLAMRLFHRLREDGAELPYIVSMTSRQLRLATLAKHLLDQGVGEREIGERLGLTHEFARRRALGQARRHSWVDLNWLYGRLLEADLSVKQGRADQDVALQMLVSEASGPRRPPQR